MAEAKRDYNASYEGEFLNRVAFPMGGIGAGMICLQGTGNLSAVSLRHHPQLYNEPMAYSAVAIRSPKPIAKVLEGPVPSWKVVFPWAPNMEGSGCGAAGKTFGLPRFKDITFAARFPFATLQLQDPDMPLRVQLTGWSPFTPPDADSSSLPVAGLEYRFENAGNEAVEAVYSFHASNFMAMPDAGVATVTKTDRGFVLSQSPSAEKPEAEGAFAAVVDSEGVATNCDWFRGGWFDAQTMVWNAIERGETISSPPPTEGPPSPGGSLFVPFNVPPGQTKTIRLLLCWYVPTTQLTMGRCETSSEQQRYEPWYAEQFSDIHEVAAHWQTNYGDLRRRTKEFSDCFYDTSLPAEVIEAAAANLSILKSPTILRQADGRLWAWEGCGDRGGCCHGSCTHVWNYAQAISHLFPTLERSLRQTEFNESQDDRGHQAFRSALPIGPTYHDSHAAADGQLGGIMQVHREWRISGDSDWLRNIWPKVCKSLDYCIETWDPNHKGILEEPHHNTYDIEFWGPNGMCGSFYLGALQAAVTMGTHLGEDVTLYESLLAKGRTYVESELFNGEYFKQKVVWQNLRAGDPTQAKALVGETYGSPEAVELLRTEGPKYQYGKGCLSDGVLGAWMAAMCQVAAPLDTEKVRSHLLSVFKYNFRKDLSEHANPQRPTYALGNEAGLLLCTWPRGGKPSLPFVYSNEVWTGIEYQVASHLMMLGYVDEGLQIVRGARSRYDGRVRNPFAEYEAGNWYARAMSSYGLLEGLTGIRYDAVTKTLTVKPNIDGDFRSFLATATGYGTAGIRNGEPFMDVVEGKIEVDRIDQGS